MNKPDFAETKPMEITPQHPNIFDFLEQNMEYLTADMDHEIFDPTTGSTLTEDSMTDVKCGGCSELLSLGQYIAFGLCYACCEEAFKDCS